jgi:hypothetical protein
MDDKKVVEFKSEEKLRKQEAEKFFNDSLEDMTKRIQTHLDSGDSDYGFNWGNIHIYFMEDGLIVVDHPEVGEFAFESARAVAEFIMINVIPMISKKRKGSHIGEIDREVMKIRGIEQDVTYHFNQTMFDDGFLIEESVFLDLENEKAQTWISLLWLDSESDILDANTYGIYIGEHLSPIQVNMIVKEIIEEYATKCLGHFIETIENDLIVQHSSASMQSEESHANEIIARMTATFDRIDEYFEERYDYED